jgi:hypothetical protein
MSRSITQSLAQHRFRAVPTASSAERHGALDKSIRRNLCSEKDDGAGVPFDKHGHAATS